MASERNDISERLIAAVEEGEKALRNAISTLEGDKQFTEANGVGRALRWGVAERRIDADILAGWCKHARDLIGKPQP